MSLGSFMKVLVIVPAGPNTVHESWYIDSSIVDFIVVWYSDETVPDTIKNRSKYVFSQKGPKWSLIRTVLQRINWKEYDYIWLPDDDLKLLKGDILTFCRIMAKYNLVMAQPSLFNQHVQWTVLLNIENQEYHLTNFVEIQAPCFSKKGFEIIIETIMHPDVNCGWGLDYVWSTILGSGIGGIGVVDSVMMEHVRYVSKKTTKQYQGREMDPFTEMKLTLSRYGVEKFKPMLV